MADRDECYKFKECMRQELISKKKTWAAMSVQAKKQVWQIFHKKLNWNPQGTDKRVNIYINTLRKKWLKQERIMLQKEMVHPALATHTHTHTHTHI